MLTLSVMIMCVIGMNETKALQPTAGGAAVTVLAAPGRLDQHPAAVYLASKPSAVSRDGLRRSLNRAAKVLTADQVDDALRVDWSQLRYQHVAALSAHLREQKAAPATINHVLTAVRGVLREAWRLGLIDAETLARAVDVPNVKADQLPAGRHVDRGEVQALFSVCTADTPASTRDAALLALLYGCGLRRSEAVALQLADYAHATGAVTVRSGKGRKDRIVYVTNGSADALNDWLGHRGTWEGALLAPVAKGGKVQARGMTAQAVLLRLRSLAKRAGVASFSPHDLRRSFVGELLDAGADISTVQKLAGHSSVTTTQRYDRRGEQTKRKAAELLHVPYRRAPAA